MPSISITSEVFHPGPNFTLFSELSVEKRRRKSPAFRVDHPEMSISSTLQRFLSAESNSTTEDVSQLEILKEVALPQYANACYRFVQFDMSNFARSKLLQFSMY